MFPCKSTLGSNYEKEYRVEHQSPLRYGERWGESKRTIANRFEFDNRSSIRILDGEFQADRISLISEVRSLSSIQQISQLVHLVRETKQESHTSGPSIRPFQNVKSESLSGKAEIPVGQDIIRDINSVLSLSGERNRRGGQYQSTLFEFCLFYGRTKQDPSLKSTSHVPSIFLSPFSSSTFKASAKQTPKAKKKGIPLRNIPSIARLFIPASIQFRTRTRSRRSRKCLRRVGHGCSSGPRRIDGWMDEGMEEWNLGQLRRCCFALLFFGSVGKWPSPAGDQIGWRAAGLYSMH